MWSRIRHPSPAMVVAMIALFVALGGAAGAVSVVPLAKRAFFADNAKKLGGKNLAMVTDQAASQPGPAIVSTKTSSITLTSEQEGYVSIACDLGQQVVSGGFSTNGAVLSLDSYPENAISWRTYLVNLLTSPAPVTLYATCLVATPESSGAAAAPATANQPSKGVRRFLDLGSP